MLVMSAKEDRSNILAFLNELRKAMFGTFPFSFSYINNFRQMMTYVRRSKQFGKDRNVLNRPYVRFCTGKHLQTVAYSTCRYGMYCRYRKKRKIHTIAKKVSKNKK